MASEAAPVAVNDRVEVEVPDGPARGRYPSRVELVDEEGRLGLAAPIRDGARVLIAPGTEVKVHALKPDPVRGGRYVGHTTVVGRRDEGRVPVLVVERPRWERVQLRDWTRASAHVPVRYRPAHLPGRRPARWIETESKDLGGGGLMMRTREPLQPGQLVELAIDLPRHRVEAVAEVVRVEREEGQEQGAPSGWAAAVRFVHIVESDRDRILRFVLRRQAEMRRMGLI